MSNDAASVPSRVYSSVSFSGSVALTGAPMSVPAAVFSATSRSAEAPSSNSGAVLGRSSSATAMLARSNSVPSSSDPATSIVRPPSTEALSTAVTVTCTEAVSAGSSTWWPVAFASASTGLTP